MAISETARLLASLELQDKFSSTIRTVEGKLDGVSTKLDGIGTKASSKFGRLRDAAKDTNTQIGFVNGALNVVEQFVPPSIRPLVQGLEDINNIAPKGILALLTTGVSSLGATVSSIGTSVATAAAGAGLSAIAAAIAIAALPIFAAEAVLALTTPEAIAAQNLAARQATASARGVPVAGVPTGDRSAPLSAVPVSQRNGAAQGVVDRETREALADQLAAQNRTNDRLEGIRSAIKPPPAPIVNITTRVQVLGQTVTTTYSRYVASIPGLLP